MLLPVPCCFHFPANPKVTILEPLSRIWRYQVRHVEHIAYIAQGPYGRQVDTRKSNVEAPKFGFQFTKQRRMVVLRAVKGGK